MGQKFSVSSLLQIAILPQIFDIIVLPILYVDIVSFGVLVDGGSVLSLRV